MGRSGSHLRFTPVQRRQVPRGPETAAGAEENARDELAARANEIARDDAFAKTKDEVARAKEMALHETAAKAKEKARSMRHAVLIVAALIIAVALAILGKRMLLY